MDTKPQTAGTTVGRAVGSSAAHAVHFAAVALSATGRFGADVASGTAAGYRDTAAVRSAQRRAAAAAVAAAKTPETAIAVSLA